MQNDDKRTSREDDTFPPEGEADAAHDDDLNGPDAPLETAPQADDTAQKSAVILENRWFGGTKSAGADIRNARFRFPGGFGGLRAVTPKRKPRTPCWRLRRHFDLPLESGTGWDSVASIERPESLRGRRRRDSGVRRDVRRLRRCFAIAVAQRAQATVMPFPGGGFSRVNEPTPVDMLRGSAANANALDDFTSTAEEQAEPSPEFDAAAQDTSRRRRAVGAAQCLWRSGRGTRRRRSPEHRGYTVADTLMGGRRSGPARRSAGSQRLAAGRSENIRTMNAIRARWKPIPRPCWIIFTVSAAPKSGNRRCCRPDSSLRDLGDAAGYSRDWQDAPDFDERSVPQPSIRDLGGVYRGGTATLCRTGGPGIPA